MKAVKRWRYYCDFCPRAGQSGFHIKKHEAHCTLNPARVCRMCVKLAEGSQANMAAMLALLPDPAAFMKHFHEERDGAFLVAPARVGLDDDGIRVALATAMPQLRELVNGCPVCIMAAFRQRKIPLPLAEDFNFTQEMDSIWADINAERDQGINY